MKLWFSFACSQQLQRLSNMVILRFFEDDVGKAVLCLAMIPAIAALIDQTFPEVDRDDLAVLNFEVLQVHRDNLVAETFKKPVRPWRPGAGNLRS